MVTINTEKILFICGGAFDGIDKIISRRLNTSVIGYRTKDQAGIDEDSILEYVTHQDLRQYGLIPELLVRVPILTYLHPLERAALIQILTKPQNELVKQYKTLIELERVERQ